MGFQSPFALVLFCLWIYPYVNGAPMSPIMPPLPPPGTCQNDIDVIAMLDSSGSVQGTWNSTIDHLMKFISNFQVSDQHTRIGIVEISKVAQVVSPLDSGNSIDSLHRLLEDLRFHPQNGQTFLGKGLQRAAEVFQGANPSRPVPKVLVTFTDGEPNEGDYAAWDSGLRDLSNQGVTLYVVAVRKNSDLKGIDALASRPSYLYIFDLDNAVGTGLYMKQSLASAVCNSMRPIPVITGGDDHDNVTGHILPPVAMPYSHDQPPPSVATSGGLSANQPQTTLGQQTPSQGAPPKAPNETQPASQGKVETQSPLNTQASKPLTIVQQVQPVASEQQADIQKPTQIGQQQQMSTSNQLSQGSQSASPVPSQEQGHGGNATKPQEQAPFDKKPNPVPQTPQVGGVSGTQVGAQKPEVAPSKPQEATGSQTQGQSGLSVPEVGLDEAVPTNKTDSVPQEHTAFKCNLTLKFLGCKRDSKIIPRPLPVLLYESEEAMKVGDPKWKEFLPRFICDCANQARSKPGFKFWSIGIQNYHQCFSGPDEGRYDEDGDAPDGTCHDENGSFCSGSSEHCAGDDGTNAVFTVITPEHKAVHRIEYD